MAQVLHDYDYIPHKYSLDDLYQLVDLLSCASDDLEDNLLMYSNEMNNEKQKVFEYAKVKINSAIQIINNYLTREKYNRLGD